MIYVLPLSPLFSRLEHIQMHEKHRGHESMHAEMVLILFATLIVSQVALVHWRKRYPHSYHVRQGHQRGRKEGDIW